MPEGDAEWLTAEVKRLRGEVAELLAGSDADAVIIRQAGKDQVKLRTALAKMEMEMEMEREARRGHAGPADRYAHYQHFEREKERKGEITVHYTAWCYYDGCIAWEDLSNCLDRREAKALAKRYGWVLTPSHGWVCPACWQKLQGAEKEESLGLETKGEEEAS